MYVNRKKIRIGSNSGDTYSFNIPIKINASPLDNEDLVKTEFVDKEVEKVINGIVDYKKVRFKPAVVKNGVWKIVPEVKYSLGFIDEDGGYIGTYDILGFTSEDLFCRVNRLMKSYLTLDYYDIPISSENALLTTSNLYTQMGSDQVNNIGIPKKNNRCPITFSLGSPTLRPNMVHEGMHIYWYDIDILSAPNQEYEMYLSPTYQNAGNGRVSIMTPYAGNITPFNSSNLQYVKVILKYFNGNFVYTFESTDDRQLKENGGGIDWNDNDGNIPNIVFYETLPNNSDSKVTDMTKGVSKDEKSEQDIVNPNKYAQEQEERESDNKKYTVASPEKSDEKKTDEEIKDEEQLYGTGFVKGLGGINQSQSASKPNNGVN
jgi:hypothetical protein